MGNLFQTTQCDWSQKTSKVTLNNPCSTIIDLYIIVMYFSVRIVNLYVVLHLDFHSDFHFSKETWPTNQHYFKFTWKGYSGHMVSSNWKSLTNIIVQDMLPGATYVIKNMFISSSQS